MQEVRDIDHHCLVTCQQRVSLYTLHLVWCWVLSIMSLTVTPATAVAGPHNHKRHSCWCAKLGYSFCSFEPEYLVTLNTCQSAEWRACTALICKHAEQASHQVENRLNAVLTTEEEEEGFYKFLPANTADRLWQSLSNPAKRHSFVSN